MDCTGRFSQSNYHTECPNNLTYIIMQILRTESFAQVTLAVALAIMPVNNFPRM